MAPDSSLEVDAREKGLHSRSVADEQAKYVIAEPEAGGNGAPMSLVDPPRTLLRLRRAIYMLSLALFVVLILGIVSAIGAGTCATRG